MKYIWILIPVIGVNVLIGTIVYNTIPKTAFVDNQQLFDAFQGRKELENKLQQESNARKSALDSLGLQIQVLQQQRTIDEITQQRLNRMMHQYQQTNQEYQGHYQQKSQEYTEAIWKQISQYTLEYGKSKGYDYVFGIAGQGSLMYGKPQYNITQDVIQYINSKYAGN
ncbi:OmpH family outer membrane protein [Aureispira anguillae]|uniref:OmpH family outer membrane protein n=1 Tax=Aureispira anguillae TaxID=2864201 RepID=A0A916DWP0_9BACT|nr:OmpH family outer membrane protein [Aureispira anguillae]BDS15666.1 OmpH family outer membrane protein [Aureispira anguillae]